MEVFYLNLARRPDRSDRFLAVNANFATFRRAEAADGRTLRTEDLVKSGLLQEPFADYSAGALGCAMSHKRMWEMCIASAASVTMAEDDAVFNRHFSEKASSLLVKLPADWDLVLWGWNFDSILHVDILPGLKDSVMQFNAAQLGTRLEDFQNRRFEVIPLRLLGAFGSVCYSISPTGARRLTERCFPLTKEPVLIPGLQRSIPNFGIDVAMNKHYRELQAYACFPPLVWTENDKSNSDVSVTGGVERDRERHE